MEATDSSGNRSVPSKYFLAEIMGTAIAIITLTLPLATIAYFSPTQNTNSIPTTNYTVSNLKK